MTGVSPFSIHEIEGQDIALRFVNYYCLYPHKIPPLLIFYGPESVGKWSLAERFARHVLCLQGSSCGICPSCKAFMHQAHPDYIEFPDNQRIAIGEEKDPSEFTVRWLQTKRLNFYPHLSQKRLIVFPDASLINNEAETALLKSLEEPPEHSRFLFIVDDLSKLKQTIVSRGVCVPFAYIPPDKARELRQKYSLPTESFIGGSLNLFNAPAEVLSLIQTKVKETAFDPLLLLELENWVRNYKDKHPQWEDDFNYDSFLELFCLVLLNFYYEQDPKQYERKMEAIFTFKEELHKKIAGLEPYLLSRLFHSLSAS